MAIQITATEIEAMSETAWSVAQRARAASLLSGVFGWITRNAPCLDAPSIEEGKVNEAKMVIAEAVLRAISSGTGNKSSESVGPSSVGYVDRSALPTLTRGDEATLKALCPSASKRRNIGTIRTPPGY